VAGAFEAPDLKMKPSEYFLRNCFLSVEADEETASQYIERFGDDNLVFSTDYPHADSKFPKSVESFRGCRCRRRRRRRSSGTTG
jgi:predicted TIM-barrel fold metal-dependent hydrolase